MPIIASMGASVTVVDFDRDGWPDLYVINSGEGTRNALYRNKGDGTFEDVAEKMGLADLNRPGDGVCMGAVWGDYDNDGYEDLLVYRSGKPELFHNDKGKGFTRVTDKVRLPNEVHANHGGKKFVEIGKATKIGDQSKSGMSACFGDVFNQGRFSIYISNITQPGVLLQWNNLWVPVPGKIGDELEYENLADSLGVARGQWSCGSQFGALNNASPPHRF